MCQPLKKILKEFEQSGWTVALGGKHWKADHPKGGRVVMAQTPSDQRAIQNIQADIKRINRRHERATQ